MQSWYRWIGASVGLAAVTALCVAYLDHPLARLTLRLEPFRRFVSSGPLDAPILSILAGSAIALARLLRGAGNPWTSWMRVATMAGAASILADVIIKYGLKSVFGRTGLGTYLRTGQDTFHWFPAGRYFVSFPSTHAGQAAAAFAVLWLFYPRWRWAYVAAQLGLVFFLVAGEFHFLGDIVAGISVGIVIGLATASIGEAISKRGRMSEILLSEVQ